MVKLMIFSIGLLVLLLVLNRRKWKSSLMLESQNRIIKPSYDFLTSKQEEISYMIDGVTYVFRDGFWFRQFPCGEITLELCVAYGWEWIKQFESAPACTRTAYIVGCSRNANGDLVCSNILIDDSKVTDPNDYCSRWYISETDRGNTSTEALDMLLESEISAESEYEYCGVFSDIDSCISDNQNTPKHNHSHEDLKFTNGEIGEVLTQLEICKMRMRERVKTLYGKDYDNILIKLGGYKMSMAEIFKLESLVRKLEKENTELRSKLKEKTETTDRLIENKTYLEQQLERLHKDMFELDYKLKKQLVRDDYIMERLEEFLDGTYTEGEEFKQAIEDLLIIAWNY